MSELTSNLKLFKYDVVEDAKQPFSIERALNDNWDLLDSKVVRKTGDTMTGNLGIVKSDNTWQSINCVNQSAEIGVIPTESVNGSRLISYDKNNYWYATVQQAIRPTTGDSYVWMTARNASGVSRSLEVRVYPDGTGGCYVNNKIITSLSMPSSKYIDLTLGASGTTYTAPANGWIAISKVSTAAHQYLCIYRSHFRTQVHSTTKDQYLEAYAPIRKGEQFKINYVAGGTTNMFKFIYAEGEK